MMLIHALRTQDIIKLHSTTKKVIQLASRRLYNIPLDVQNTLMGEPMSTEDSVRTGEPREQKMPTSGEGRKASGEGRPADKEGKRRRKDS